MRLTRRFAVLAVASIATAVPAAAQTAAGTPFSFGADVGIFAPFEGGSSASFTARVTGDFFWWRPLGMRFAAGFANPSLGDEPFQGHVNMAYVSAALIQTFSGTPRPFWQGGVGIYNLSGNGRGTQLGVHLGGGVQIPLSLRRTFLAPELTAYVISGDAPRFSLALTVGLHTRPE